MSAQQQSIEVKLDKIVFPFEDIAKIDAILGTMPYKVVKPIYAIIEQRMLEQGQAKAEEMQAKKEQETSQIEPQLEAIRQKQVTKNIRE